MRPLRLQIWYFFNSRQLNTLSKADSIFISFYENWRIQKWKFFWLTPSIFSQLISHLKVRRVLGSETLKIEYYFSILIDGGRHLCTRIKRMTAISLGYHSHCRAQQDKNSFGHWVQGGCYLLPFCCGIWTIDGPPWRYTDETKICNNLWKIPTKGQ